MQKVVKKVKKAFCQGCRKRVCANRNKLTQECFDKDAYPTKPKGMYQFRY